MQKSDHPAFARFILMYVLFFTMSALVVVTWSKPLWQLILSQIGFGIMCCSIFASIHETTHNTAFKSRFMNEFAARLGGLSHLYPATAFRELHFTHHRYTHIPGMDPEISFANKPLPSVLSNLPTYLGWITGLPMLVFKIGMIFNGALGMREPIRTKFYSFIRPEVRLKLAIESIYIILIYSGIVLLAIYFNPAFWALFIAQVTGHCILAGYLVPEHNGLPHEGDIFARTRSMRTNKFIKLLMWNMPFHAEHHAYPAIPFHALPDLHEKIKEEILHKNDGYPDFHLKVISGNFSQEQLSPGSRT